VKYEGWTVIPPRLTDGDGARDMTRFLKEAVLLPNMCITTVHHPGVHLFNCSINPTFGLMPGLFSLTNDNASS